jgi:two-component system LytT family sensor kinase
MKSETLQRILSMLGSRLARNVYFWLCLFLIKYSDIEDQYAYSNAFYYSVMIFLMLFFVVLTYVNNFVLVPKLLVKKKWYLYVPAMLAFSFVMAVSYIITLKALQHSFPGISTPDLSIITTPISSDLTFNSVMEDLVWFYPSMVIWCIIFSLFAYYNESSLKVKLMQETINKHRETELAFLKNQINPHFLFNTLNNLYSLSLKKSEETPEAILKLSSILRYILYESNVEQVAFEKEKEVMLAYIDIELLRLPESPGIQFSVMTDKPQSIPPLLWLPVLENAFKHSRSASDMLEIDFRFSIYGDKLTVYCKNSVSAKASKDIETGTGGIGLSNLRKRLNLLYPEKHIISITSDRNFYIIEVQITLH